MFSRQILKPSSKDEGVYKALSEIFGEEDVSKSELDRISYSRDSWSKTSLWLRDGEIRYPPDYIVWAKDVQQISRLLRFAQEKKIPVIPYGGGSGVCGGTLPLKGGIILDLKKMDKILSLNDKSLTVTAEVGIIGERLERELNRKGYTLGHHPQSIYCSTLGGWLAARSAGQLSTKYGKIEDMVLSMQVVLPDGDILETKTTPKSATGPDFTQTFVGSEGTLGVITKATLRVSPYPELRAFSGFMFGELALGLETIRKILRRGVRPASVRLYDPLDTFVFKLTGEKKESKGRRILKMAKDKVEDLIFLKPQMVNKLASLVKGRCLLIFMFEGDREIIETEKRVSDNICRVEGGEDLGEKMGIRWWETRFDVAYNLSKVFKSGAFADTIEVAGTWDKLFNLYEEVKSAVSPYAFIMAHFSHAYKEGCSVYFSFLSRGKDKEESEELFSKIWELALSACAKAGGTISHHHGVGIAKANFMEGELGGAMKVYKRLKQVLDPNNILNPGKMGLDK